jgi:hypothetical protein
MPATGTGLTKETGASAKHLRHNHKALQNSFFLVFDISLTREMHSFDVRGKTPNANPH